MAKIDLSARPNMSDDELFLLVQAGFDAKYDVEKTPKWTRVRGPGWSEVLIGISRKEGKAPQIVVAPKLQPQSLMLLPLALLLVLPYVLALLYLLGQSKRVAMEVQGHLEAGLVPAAPLMTSYAGHVLAAQ